MTEVKFQPGQTIVREGERGTTAFIIKSGRVEIARDQEGRKKVLAQLGPGGVVGEMALVDDQPRMANATALDTVICTLVNRDAFNRAISNSPPLARYLLNTFVRNIRAASGVRLTSVGAASTQSSIMRSIMPEMEADIRAEHQNNKLIERRHFPADAVVFRQGTTGTAAYLIQTGTIEILRTEEDGTQKMLGRLTTGDVFGELALLGNMGMRQATAVVVEPATCEIINKTYFNSLLAKSPLFIRALFKIYAGHLEDLARGMSPGLMAGGTEGLMAAKM